MHDLKTAMSFFGREIAAFTGAAGSGAGPRTPPPQSIVQCTLFRRQYWTISVTSLAKSKWILEAAAILHLALENRQSGTVTPPNQKPRLRQWHSC